MIRVRFQKLIIIWNSHPNTSDYLYVIRFLEMMVTSKPIGQAQD